MHGARKYFNDRAIRNVLIGDDVDPAISGVITIPAYAEGKLLETLESLAACRPPKGVFEVLVLVNHGKSAPGPVKEQNRKVLAEAHNWVKNHTSDHLQYHILHDFDVEDKKAGVGTARKILMDEAARRLVQRGRTQLPIVGLDADCLVSENYLAGIEDYFGRNADIRACSIEFAHRTDDLNPVQRKAILQYEQHLRYFIAMQRRIGFPHAYQTIGSAMAVRCSAYIRQGGMNRRKAGEDFYFLHKFIELGNYGELAEVTVYPSGRVSDRVPFGTGKAVADALANGGIVFTYNPLSYLDLKTLFDQVDNFWEMDLAAVVLLVDGMPQPVNEFLQTIDYQINIEAIKSHTSDRQSFRKRFFRWFNAFQLMKYLHFARDHFYPDVPVDQLNWGNIECR